MPDQIWPPPILADDPPEPDVDHRSGRPIIRVLKFTLGGMLCGFTIGAPYGVLLFAVTGWALPGFFASSYTVGVNALSLGASGGTLGLLGGLVAGIITGTFVQNFPNVGFLGAMVGSATSGLILTAILKPVAGPTTIVAVDLIPRI